MENVIYENEKFVVEEVVPRSNKKEAKTFKLSPQTISCIAFSTTSVLLTL